MGRSTRRPRCAPPPAGSAEQPRALLLLELSDLTADHRLRNIENGFHLRELAQLDDLGEDPPCEFQDQQHGGDDLSASGVPKRASAGSNPLKVIGRMFLFRELG